MLLRSMLFALMLVLAGCNKPENTADQPATAPNTATAQQSAAGAQQSTADAQQPPTAAQSDEAQSATEGASPTDALPPMPNHFTNSRPIGNSEGPVTNANLRAGLKDPSQWLLYGGNYSNYRHSPVTDLTPTSLDHLQVAWSFPTGTTGQFEASPVIYDGIMYVTSSYNRLFALNPATGELYWRYDVKLPSDLRLCCGPANRGVGISGDLVIMATLDAKLIAFNRLSGEKVWETTIANYKDGYSATSAPMIVKNMAIIGVAGGEYGVSGFFDAYDVKTGKRLWRHYTLPQKKSDPGADTWAGDSFKTGGSPAWTSGAYDPETDTLYWTTGNPSPDWNGDSRKGDNLYADSLLAIDPNTGDQKWYFQFTPHDVWDYDGNTQIFLTDVTQDGKSVKAIVQANRNGYFYMLNRETGKFISASPYLEKITWATINDKGRPVVNPGAIPNADPNFLVCPGNLGGMNGSYTGSLDPKLGLAFIPTLNSCQKYQKGLAIYIKGNAFMGGMPAIVGKPHGELVGLDYKTGQVKWRYRDEYPMMAGAVSTAGGVVFTGDQEGFALGLNSKTGKLLWKFRMGGGVRSQPVVYQVDGKSYVAIGSGNWSTMAGFSGGPIDIPEGGQLFVFTLKK